jgi:hypothetical protein
MSKDLVFYQDLLADIKTRLRQSQHRAALSANAEMLRMYWDIGRLIAARQKQKGWSTGVIPRLAVGSEKRTSGTKRVFCRQHQSDAPFLS